MKKAILLAFLFSFHFSFSQNLVPNNSFETHVPCNSFSGSIKDSPPWFFNNYPFGGTAYYFHPCSPFFFLYFNVPRNLTDTTGYQWPYFGNAYSGINVFYNQASNNRNYLQVKLNDTLIANRKYCVEFYVNLCNNSFYGTDVIGACLTSDTLNCAVPSFSCLINAVPQIVSPPGIPIIDTLNWTKISGSFTAIGNEAYITIGNFSPDTSLTLGVNNAVLQNSSFYYIDDVSVYVCDSSSAINDLVKQQELNVFPNPANNLITVSNSKLIDELCLLDVSGKVVLQQKQVKVIDVSELVNGLYMLRCKFQDGEVLYKKIVVQHE
jgi:hypothetical protein